MTDTPAARAAAIHAATLAPGVSDAGGAVPAWVAIVDDDASVRGALARVLRAHGIPVRTFAGAFEYLTAREAGTPACLVLDVHLGGMSGLELHDHLAASGATEMVVLMTAHDDVPADELARRVGPGAFLRKPFDGDVLVAIVRRALRRPPDP